MKPLRYVVYGIVPLEQIHAFMRRVRAMGIEINEAPGCGLSMHLLPDQVMKVEAICREFGTKLTQETLRSVWIDDDLEVDAP